MNMDYCKFVNTLAALRQCADGWDKESNSPSEMYSKTRLIELMIDILNKEGYQIDQVDQESTDFLPAFSKSGLRIG